MFTLSVVAYVQEIYETFLTATKKDIKDAAQKLSEMTPEPMNSMLDKQSKADAIAKTPERSKMVIQDIPSTTPGTNISNIIFFSCMELIMIFLSTCCVIFYSICQ